MPCSIPQAWFAGGQIYNISLALGAHKKNVMALDWRQLFSNSLKLY